MLFTVRLSFVLLILIAVVYSIYVLKKGFLPTYFKCAFYGLLCELAAALYYLALSTDNSLTDLFTVAIFGEIAFFLFVITANIRFVPREENEKKRPFSLWGFIAATVVAALLIIAMLIETSAQNIICNLIYLTTLPTCIYYCVAAMENKYKNPFRRGTFLYNALITVLILICGMMQLLLAYAAAYNSYFCYYGYLIANILAYICVCTAQFALKKGLEPWEI